jgi:hypothetical protein
MIVVMYKTDRAGRPHYYTLHDRQGNLFSPFSLSVQWGASPNSGREKEYIFKNAAEKETKIRQTIRKRFLTGYKLLYSFTRKPEERRFIDGFAINL